MTEFFQKINWTDLLVVILLIRSSYVGFTRGFSWECFRFIGVICAVLIPIYFYESVSQLIGDYFPVIYPFSNLLSFTALYILIFIISKIINILIEKIIKIEVFSMLERFGGFCLGVMRGSIILSLIFISLILTPVPYFEKSIKERSYTGPVVSKVAPFLYEKIAIIFPALKFGQRNEALIKITGYKEGFKVPQKGSVKGDIE